MANRASRQLTCSKYISAHHRELQPDYTGQLTFAIKNSIMTLPGWSGSRWRPVKAGTLEESPHCIGRDAG